MTPDGNHGGASPLETGAGLFAYSTEPIFEDSVAGEAETNVESSHTTVSQIDLVLLVSLFTPRAFSLALNSLCDLRSISHASPFR